MLKTVVVDIYNIEWAKPELDECEWHCDNCGALLDNQDGFDPYCGTWECENCGHENDISQDNIIQDLPTSVGGLSFMVTSASDLRNQIEEYLNYTYDSYVEDFDYDTDEPIEEDEVDDDYELANFCRGGFRRGLILIRVIYRN